MATLLDLQESFRKLTRCTLAIEAETKRLAAIARIAHTTPTSTGDDARKRL